MRTDEFLNGNTESDGFINESTESTDDLILASKKAKKIKSLHNELEDPGAEFIFNSDKK